MSSTKPRSAPNGTHLTVLEGGLKDQEPKSDDPRRRRFAQYLPHLALATTVAILGAYKARPLLESGSSKGAPSVEELRAWPHQVTVTPVTQKAAVEGASAIGELVDPQVYQGPNSSSTETSNLDNAISSTGIERVGESFRVPVLDPKAVAAHPRQLDSPDFVVGPAK